MTPQRVWDKLDDLIEREHVDGAEIVVKVDVHTLTMWGGELIYVPKPHNPNGPDRGFTFYAAGGQTPDEVVERLLDDFAVWKASAQDRDSS